MNGMPSVGRRATTGAARSRRNMYSGDFETESADHASGAPVTGGIFKNAAFEILKQEERLMTSGEITKLAIERKLLRCMGKTPENTMASALYTEVRKKAITTVFIKPKEGLFGLKAWLSEPWLLNWLIQEGIDVADLHDPGGCAEPVPKKIRTSYNGVASRAGGGAAGTCYPHRTSSNGAQMRSSSTGLVAGSQGVPAAGTSAGQMASMSGGHGPGAGGSGGGSGSGGRWGSYTSLGPVPTANGGGIPKPPYLGGGGGRGVMANSMVAAGGTSGSIGVSDALSSLHLLVDAADEIEGGPDEGEEEPHGDAASRRPPPARRRSDGRQTTGSFLRPQQPPINRETSLPSLIAQVRIVQGDDPEGKQEEEEEVVVAACAAAEDGDEGEGEPNDDAAATTPHCDAVLAFQQRQQSSNQLRGRGGLSLAVEEPFPLKRQLEEQHMYRQQQLQQPSRSAEVPAEGSDDEEGELEQLQAQQKQAQQQEKQLQRDGREGPEGELDEVRDDDGNDDEANRAASGVRWGQGATEVGSHPGSSYRSLARCGARGGRLIGRAALGGSSPAAVKPGRGRGGSGGGGGRGRPADRMGAFGVRPVLDKGDGTDGDDEGEEDADWVSGEDTESAQQRHRWRWAPSQRSGEERRTGGGGGGAGSNVRPWQPVGTRFSGALPPYLGHLPARGMPMQPPIPMMHVPPPGCPRVPPLHLLQGMPPGAAAAAAAAAGLPCSPGTIHAMLAAAGGGHGIGAPGGVLPPPPSDHHLRALLAGGGGPLGLPGLALGLTPAQFGPLLGSQVLPPGLGMGLPGLDFGALVGDVPANLAAAAIAAAGGNGACGYPLPPSLAQMATVLGRAPGLSATLVAAQNRIADMGDAVATTSRERVDDAGSGDLKVEGEERGRGLKAGASGGGGNGTSAAVGPSGAEGGGWDADADADMADADPRVSSRQPGKGGPRRKACRVAVTVSMTGHLSGATNIQPPQADAGAVVESAPAGGGDGAGGGHSARRPLNGGGGDGGGREHPQPQQPCQQGPFGALGLLRAPVTLLSPVGGPPTTSVAVHDAMNSPDSQVAGSSAERSSPATDEAGRHSRGTGSQGHSGQQGVMVGQRRVAPSPRQAAGGVVSPRSQPSSSSGGRRLEASGAGGLEAVQGQAAAGALAQLTLLQQQHLKLLLPVDAARPGDVPDPGAINRIRHQVLEVESRLGPLHPETGRVYVLLARVLEHKGTCWSLAMAERALLRAWTIVSVVSSSFGSDSGRTSDVGAAAAAASASASAGGALATVAGVAEAAAAEAGADTLGEMLQQLPNSFNTFQYLLEQIRMKQSYLQEQQEQQLLALLQMVAMVGSSAPAASATGVGVGGSSSGGGARPAPRVPRAAATAAALGGARMLGTAALPPGV